MEHSNICGCLYRQSYGTTDVLLRAKPVQGISPDSCAKFCSYLPLNLILYSSDLMYIKDILYFESSLGENCSCLPEVAILPMMFSFSTTCSCFFPVGVCLNILSSFNAGLFVFFWQWVIFSRLLCLCCF